MKDFPDSFLPTGTNDMGKALRGTFALKTKFFSSFKRNHSLHEATVSSRRRKSLQVGAVRCISFIPEAFNGTSTSPSITLTDRCCPLHNILYLTLLFGGTALRYRISQDDRHLASQANTPLLYAAHTTSPKMNALPPASCILHPAPR